MTTRGHATETRMQLDGGMPTDMAVLQPGVGPLPGDHYLRSTPETVLWGRLPCETDAAVLRIASGETVTIDTVSHEGILEDHGKDPLAYFTGQGVAAAAVLEDAIAIAASPVARPRRGRPSRRDRADLRGGRRARRSAAHHGREARAARAVRCDLEPARQGRSRGRAAARRLPRQRLHAGRGARGAAGRPASGRRRRRARGRLPARRPSSARWGSRSPATSARTRCRPDAHGGNIDINLLVEGTVLYLPVQVAGRARRTSAIRTSLRATARSR